MVWLAFALVFAFLYLVGRRAVINEVRIHARGVAIAAAACLEAAKLESIRGPEDVHSDTYRDLQNHLDRIVRLNTDIRYIYTMRRSPEPFAPPHAFVYVVDQPARDRNGDGVINPDEQSEPPGMPYDASRLPALIEGWERPAADDRIMPDPPYPDLLSGYAPIQTEDGRTVALVGVDVTAHTVRGKLRILKLVSLIVWLLIVLLITLIVRLYYQQREAYEEIKRLSDELAARHELLRRAATQRGGEAAELAPSAAATPRTLIDRYDLRVAQVGSAPAGCYALGHDHAAFFLASIPGDPAGASLSASYIRMALLMMVQAPGSESNAAVYVDALNPAAVLNKAMALMAAELPVDQAVALAYAVIDFSRNECRLAVAGSAFVLLRWKLTGKAERLDVPVGPPLAADSTGGYLANGFPIEEGDRILLAEAGTAPIAEVESVLLAATAPIRELPAFEQAARLAAALPDRGSNLVVAEYR